MVQYRDITLKKQEDADTKENKHRTFRAMLCNAWGDVTGGSVWADQSTRSVNFLPIGGRQIAQAKCYRLEPTLGLCVLMGYTDGSVVLEVISDDPLLRDTNTTGSSYLTPTPEDLQPGGRLQTWLYSKLFVPLSVYPSTTTLAVYIAGGYYTYHGTVKYYPETTGAGISLTSPTDIDTHYYAGLYIDGTNTAQVIYSAANPTDTDPIEPTWPTGVVRLCVVYLAYGQTLISLANDIFDRRIYYTENVSSAWPAAGKVNISTVEYPTVTAAFAAAVASDFIKVGEGTFSEAGALTLPDETNMRGSGMGVSVIDVDSGSPALTATYGGAIIEKLTIQQLTAPAATVAISADGITFREVEAYNNSSNQTGFSITDCTLWECTYTGLGTAINAVGGTSYIIGGYFPSDILVDAGATVRFDYPIITGTITNNGTCAGWYYDGSGLLHSFGTGGAGQVLQQSTLSGAISVGIYDDPKWTYINRQGFVDNTQTTIGFNDGTYVFTLTDAGAGWQYFRDGIVYTISGNKTVTLPGTPPAAGFYYIYIDANDGTLTQSTIAWTLLDNKLPVATVYWNNTLTPKYWLADERHTCLIDSREHYLEHVTSGTLYISGAALSGYTVDGSTDAENTFAISAAYIADEDLLITLAQLPDPGGISTDYVVFYRTAAATWAWEASAMPYRYTAAGYIQYDNAGTMTQGQNNKWYNTYLLLTDIVGAARFTIIHGRSEFSSLAAAQSESPIDFSFAGFSIAESVIAYRLTWHTLTSYTTKGKANLAAEPAAIRIITATAAGGSAPSLVIPSTIDNFVSFYDTVGQQKDSGYSAATLNTAYQTNAAANKATPVDADKFPLADSAASFALKHTLWSDIKTTLQTWLGTLLDATKVSKLAASDGTPDPAWATDAAGALVGQTTQPIKGTGSNFPNIGTTTLAEKFGDIYLGTGKSIYPDDDAYDLWNRTVNWGYTPDEHWAQGADELVWTGWATYTGYGTPSSLTYSNSFYIATGTSAVTGFRYRAASTGADIYLRCRVAITQVATAGIMIDDGVDAGDNNGANNFYRAYITQASVGAAVYAVEQYRVGGGAVTTVSSVFTFPPTLFAGLAIATTGTRWSAWSASPSVFGESGQLLQFSGGTRSLSWTPAYVGLYFSQAGTTAKRKGIWDWYDEATS